MTILIAFAQCLAQSGPDLRMMSLHAAAIKTPYPRAEDWVDPQALFSFLFVDILLCSKDLPFKVQRPPLPFLNRYKPQASPSSPKGHTT